MSWAVFWATCLLAAAAGDNNPVPLVIWHGMGDTCCDGLSYLKEWLEREIPGIYIKSLQFGSSLFMDRWYSFFSNVSAQVEMVCDELSQDQKLNNGFNAVGFSQGGQFLRALVQRCAKVKVYNLITLGSQHQGIYGFPFCMDSWLCDMFRRLLSMGVYLSFVQTYFVQAQFWHDPIHEDRYRLTCAFLSDINQEIEVKPAYKERMSKLSNFIMVKFLNDKMVQPSESGWFGFYRSGQASDIYTLNESDMMKMDKLGLQYLRANGRLHLVSYPSGHLQMSKHEFAHLIPFINVTYNNARERMKL